MTPYLAKSSQVFQNNDSVAWTFANTAFFGNRISLLWEGESRRMFFEQEAEVGVSYYDEKRGC